MIINIIVVIASIYVGMFSVSCHITAAIIKQMNAENDKNKQLGIGEQLVMYIAAPLILAFSKKVNLNKEGEE